MIGLLLATFFFLHARAEFVLKEIDLTEKEYEECTYCDQRSERTGNDVVARALREYLSKAPGELTKLAVDSGEVTVSQRFPNEGIDTGHSCSKTAEAIDNVGTSRMIPGSVVLDKTKFAYNEIFKFAIAGGDVDSEVVFNSRIRVRFGFKFFGKCKTLMRKTCSVKAKSSGTNEILVSLQASNIQVLNKNLVFKLGAKVFGKAKENSFPPLQIAQDGSCNLEVLGIKIGSINGLIRKYSNRYFSHNTVYRELATPRLIEKLEEVLGARLGDDISIPIKVNGIPQRGKRSVANGTKICPKTCPEGWARAGNQNKCIKHFGPSKVDCAKVHKDAKLEIDNSIPGIPLYMCIIPF